MVHEWTWYFIFAWKFTASIYVQAPFDSWSLMYYVSPFLSLTQMLFLSENNSEITYLIIVYYLYLYLPNTIKTSSYLSKRWFAFINDVRCMAVIKMSLLYSLMYVLINGNVLIRTYIQYRSLLDKYVQKWHRHIQEYVLMIFFLNLKIKHIIKKEKL